MSSKEALLFELKENLKCYLEHRNSYDVDAVQAWLAKNDEILEKLNQLNTSPLALTSSEASMTPELKQLKEEIAMLSQQISSDLKKRKDEAYHQVKRVNYNVQGAKTYLDNSRYY